MSDGRCRRAAWLVALTCLALAGTASASRYEQGANPRCSFSVAPSEGIHFRYGDKGSCLPTHWFKAPESPDHQSIGLNRCYVEESNWFHDVSPSYRRSYRVHACDQTSQTLVVDFDCDDNCKNCTQVKQIVGRHLCDGTQTQFMMGRNLAGIQCPLTTNREEIPPATCLTVADAGDSSYNGQYCDSGSKVNGQPLFTHTASDSSRQMSWDGNNWLMGPQGSTAKYVSNTLFPAANNGWAHNDFALNHNILSCMLAGTHDDCLVLLVGQSSKTPRVSHPVLGFSNRKSCTIGVQSPLCQEHQELWCGLSETAPIIGMPTMGACSNQGLNAHCDACTGPSPSQCVVVTCNDGFFDLDGQVSNGCEAVNCNIIPMVHASCTECSGSSSPAQCSALSCEFGYVDQDGITANGCEHLSTDCATAAIIGNGVCETCILDNDDAMVCLSVASCDEGYFLDNGDCKPDWSQFKLAADVPHATCTSHWEHWDKGTMTLRCGGLRCDDGWERDDGDWRKGDDGCQRCQHPATATSCGSCNHALGAADPCVDPVCRPGYSGAKCETTTTCFDAPNMYCADEDGCSGPNLADCDDWRCIPGHKWSWGQKDWSEEGCPVIACGGLGKNPPNTWCPQGKCSGPSWAECTDPRCARDHWSNTDGNWDTGCANSHCNTDKANMQCDACRYNRDSDCFKHSCAPGWFDYDGERENGCESNEPNQCAAVPHASCTKCNGTASAADCLELTCDAGWIDTDGDGTTGCDMKYCPFAVDNARCTACDSSDCTELGECAAGWTDADGLVSTGCETRCSSAVAHGTCTACSGPTAAECTALECDSTWGDDDDLASTGCEAQCSAVDHATCTACTGSIAADCTALGECQKNWFNFDGLASSGCETTLLPWQSPASAEAVSEAVRVKFRTTISLPSQAQKQQDIGQRIAEDLQAELRQTFDQLLVRFVSWTAVGDRRRRLLSSNGGAAFPPLEMTQDEALFARVAPHRHAQLMETLDYATQFNEAELNVPSTPTDSGSTVDGDATTARFNNPSGLSVTDDGLEAFVAGDSIRLLTLSNGSTQTVATRGVDFPDKRSPSAVVATGTDSQVYFTLPGGTYRFNRLNQTTTKFLADWGGDAMTRCTNDNQETAIIIAKSSEIRAYNQETGELKWTLGGTEDDSEVGQSGTGIRLRKIRDIDAKPDCSELVVSTAGGDPEDFSQGRMVVIAIGTAKSVTHIYGRTTTTNQNANGGDTTRHFSSVSGVSWAGPNGKFIIFQQGGSTKGLRLIDTTNSKVSTVGEQKGLMPVTYGLGVRSFGSQGLVALTYSHGVSIVRLDLGWAVPDEESDDGEQSGSGESSDGQSDSGESGDGQPVTLAPDPTPLISARVFDAEFDFSTESNDPMDTTAQDAAKNFKQRMATGALNDVIISAVMKEDPSAGNSMRVHDSDAADSSSKSNIPIALIAALGGIVLVAIAVICCIIRCRKNKKKKKSAAASAAAHTAGSQASVQPCSDTTIEIIGAGTTGSPQ